MNCRAGPVGDTVTAVSMPGAEGAAAEAIRAAETALARQNSAAAHIDLEVVTAVLNAHAAHTGGVDALQSLQAEIEAAVTSRTDLDTPAGAREFQRYLVDKLYAIRTVVEEADLDDTSKAALAAALASLYASSGSAGSAPVAGDTGTPPVSGATGTAPVAGNTASAPLPSPLPPVAEPSAALPAPDEVDPGGEGFADFGPLDFPYSATNSGAEPAVDPGPAQPAAGAAGAAPSIPAIPAVPGLGGGGMPGIPPLGGLSSLPALSALADRPGDLVPPEPAREEADDASGPADPADPAQPETEPEPGYAGVIAEAVSGTPIADAFDHQGITIPEPGSPVGAPLETGQIVAGDIAVFDDRHALALGNGKALLDDQIQPIETVNRPGFLGWQHPPDPTADPD